ncbi:uncharacterized protein MELLADRAFT_62371 [Melampsora larici-populina 98AG31]|uniref:Uncharacterized protein n=1 Tax=Melampsora larici-populina (strain 98AG31 / pathotype 3-4-7) TaxID=747676 RepID=F4RIQ9_MELLP|nr:uncharacterized protein MELLADRAFT_62371 [Melampsora larici-populina 98AG31]EGG07787.1 hypothetical protein MELLADRAFT_62371 [Melampsora larici-populina 98AG31]
MPFPHFRFHSYNFSSVLSLLSRMSKQKRNDFASTASTPFSSSQSDPTRSNPLYQPSQMPPQLWFPIPNPFLFANPAGHPIVSQLSTEQLSQQPLIPNPLYSGLSIPNPGVQTSSNSTVPTSLPPNRNEHNHSLPVPSSTHTTENADQDETSLDLEDFETERDTDWPPIGKIDQLWNHTQLI